MRIILFRHGPAGTRDASKWPNDTQRPLTRRGEQRCVAAAYGIARFAPEVGLIVTSPLVRATQSANLLLEPLGRPKLETLDALRPGGSYRLILEFLTSRASKFESMVLVGHEPDLGKLAGTLLFGAPTVMPLKKAGACEIRFNGAIGAGEGQLMWFLPAKMLRRVAGKKGRV